MFKNREESGRKLAEALQAYKNDKNSIVLGLPRGGVVVAAEVAKILNLPLDITCPRKIGFPFHEEFAIGAITETGQSILNETLINSYGVNSDYIEQTKEIEKQKAQHRLNVFRKGMPSRNLKGKNVIIIDDGIATGYTLKAAIQTVKSEKAKKIIVAVPVGPNDSVLEIQKLVDEVICLEIPPFFQAVGQFYEQFFQVEDEEVIKIMSEIQLHHFYRQIKPF